MENLETISERIMMPSMFCI